MNSECQMKGQSWAAANRCPATVDPIQPVCFLMAVDTREPKGNRIQPVFVHSGMNEQIKQFFINMKWNTTATEKSHTLTNLNQFKSNKSDVGTVSRLFP